MIDKETFCKIIEDLRQQIYLDSKFGEEVKEMFGYEGKCTYNSSLLVKSIMTLLNIHFPKDEDGFCEISHYCFTIDFGKSENQNIITAEDLYDSLVSKI